MIELQSPNRQVGGKPLEHLYDQTAWFDEDKDGPKPLLSLHYTGHAGLLDWAKTAFANSGRTSQKNPSVSLTTNRFGLSSCA